MERYKYKTGRPKKIFNKEVGKIFHNSEEMQGLRKRRTEIEEEDLKRKKEEMQAEIAREKEEAERYERDIEDD